MIPNCLVWMDLEMTGLDPDKERIIEMAMLITDSELQVIAEGPEIVVKQPESLLAAMDDWNQEHHSASGLLDLVRASATGETEAERQALDFITQHCTPGTAPLAGNSVHQDRAFLRRYMPKLEAHLHYRNVDVSTLKELVKRWYPEVAASAPAKRERHRALEDIHDSIAELAYYRQCVFIAPS